MFVNKNHQRGFIALISAIITSAVLLIIAVALSLSSFYGRYNVLDTELKKMSVGLAEACVEQGLLMLATNTNNPATTTVEVIKGKYCDLGPIPPSGNLRTFLTQASSSSYFTTLKISVNPDTNFSITSWEEVR